MKLFVEALSESGNTIVEFNSTYPLRSDLEV